MWKKEPPHAGCVRRACRQLWGTWAAAAYKIASSLKLNLPSDERHANGAWSAAPRSLAASHDGLCDVGEREHDEEQARELVGGHRADVGADDERGDAHLREAAGRSGEEGGRKPCARDAGDEPSHAHAHEQHEEHAAGEDRPHAVILLDMAQVDVRADVGTNADLGGIDEMDGDGGR